MTNPPELEVAAAIGRMSKGTPRALETFGIEHAFSEYAKSPRFNTQEAREILRRLAIEGNEPDLARRLAYKHKILK